jgi:hypothetical protein
MFSLILRRIIMGILAIVFGILGIILGWLPYIQWLALVLSIIGIVFAALTLKKVSASEGGKGKGVAVAGLVLCIIGAVSSGVNAIVCTVCFATAGAGSTALIPEILQAFQVAQEVFGNLTRI